MEKTGFKELNSQELVDVDGGSIAVIIAASALVLAVFAFGYQVGKDRAEADQR